ncbi:MAG TPA: RNA 2'-phosphotransferase [Tepidisphaeraceae bacterium]|jgi:putative RNA 2'-phosphotransferase
MPDDSTIRLSKFLSLVLRHKPDEIGLMLDAAGWVAVDDLLTALARHDHPITREQLVHLVQSSDKKRFAFSDDGRRIRASQGHSVEVDLGYTPATPPERLYHGTVARLVPSIRQGGLVKGQRHHVHLSRDVATAAKVGDRRGKAVILTIDAARMHADGLVFFVSANGVWLSDHVPSEYIQFPSENSENMT